MRINNKKGFTIVELVIVIAVIAILAGVLIPTFSGVVKKAKENAALQEVKNAYTATLADDLSTPETEGDKVNVDTDIYVIVDEDIYIKIDKDGKASVATGTPSATHTLTDGKLEPKTPTSESTEP
jgi:type IV pilus assembly protein PilA